MDLQKGWDKSIPMASSWSGLSQLHREPCFRTLRERTSATITFSTWFRHNSGWIQPVQERSLGAHSHYLWGPVMENTYPQNLKPMALSKSRVRNPNSTRSTSHFYTQQVLLLLNPTADISIAIHQIWRRRRSRSGILKTRLMWDPSMMLSIYLNLRIVRTDMSV